MKPAIFLVGVRGAGKTTLLGLLASNSNFCVLKPSTTRARRSPTESEYHFVSPPSAWRSGDYHWEININAIRYGMSRAEFSKAPSGSYALTVFSPSDIDTLKNFRNHYDGKVLTIGIDTISDIAQQAQRVNNDPSRVMSESEFLAQLEVVRNCDVVLSGDEGSLEDAMGALIECLDSRGGIIQRTLIERFLRAGLLLQGTSSGVAPASYDLRLGDDVWCQGKLIRLDGNNPFLKIPAYSYAIVSAKEIANLPSFIAARFDLKNSLFFRGVILSNGPQIDPGYRGALFCMLYNGSDQPIGLTRDTHFATIEFVTTAGYDLGYRDKYQGKTRLADFMPADVAVSEGGRILERVEEKVDDVIKAWDQWKTWALGVAAIILPLVAGLLVAIYFEIWTKNNELTESVYSKLDKLSVLEVELKALQVQISESEQDMQKVINQSQKQVKVNDQKTKKAVSSTGK